MSERKVLNKYYPPNFDPSLIPRRKMGKDKQQVVRLMAPFSMRCAYVNPALQHQRNRNADSNHMRFHSTCGEYIYKGKKFNARKETVDGEDYYGIKIFRFYIKCTQCSAEITFKTDPKNTDYVAEHGAARNFEPWRDTSAIDPEEDKLARMEEEENNPMAALENKAVDSKREMDILDALQELKTRNARLERAGKEAPEKFLDRVSSGVEVGDRELSKKLTAFEEAKKKAEEEDEEEVRKVFGRAFMDGVPDIELDAGGASEDDTESEPGTLRESEDEASGSGSTSGSASGTLKRAKEASIKRKLDTVEPTPASLLSAAQKSIVQKSFGSGASMGPPAKKNKKGGKGDLAAKLGIKLGKK
ncbi:hypothetical protein P7C70_g7777, partial [Phenoliferia sp. Uapishka_3]